jgi:hypothetical protein
MAEQAINTIYVLGEQPDALCSTIMREMTTKVFGKSFVQESLGDNDTSKQASEEERAEEADGAATSPDGSPSLQPSDGSPDLRATSVVPQTPGYESQPADAFQLAQAVFVAGHCAVKHLIHLELVERDHKRRKAEAEKSGPRKSAGGEELDQVAGSVEDDIGDFIQATRETELLYGPDSLFSIYAPMTVQISANPKMYPVSLATNCFVVRKILTRAILESHASSCCSVIDEQVHVCQCQVLRRPLDAPVQDSRDHVGPSGAKQHCDCVGRHCCVLQHDHGREQRPAVRRAVGPRLDGEEAHIDGAHSPHLERDDQSQGTARRDGKVSRGRGAPDKRSRKVILHRACDEGQCHLQ